LPPLLLVLGLLQGEERPYGIGMWVQANTEQLIEALQPARGRLPSFSALYRALQAMSPERMDFEKTLRYQVCPK